TGYVQIVKAIEECAHREIKNRLIEEAINKVSEEVNPISDIRASEEYRRYISGILFKRAFKKLTNLPINTRK
ncbi:unnamed protein product, partial [marine sediment metagenome]